MNTQRIEKSVRSLDGTVQVHSIFHTIQGEGPFCGQSAIFIRLTGCNLNCPMCDTDYTSRRMAMSPGLILQRCVNYSAKGLVVITGGEPFRQDIGTLVNELVNFGYYVQIETNGTLAPSNNVDWSKRYWERKGAYIVCSPKTGRINSILEAEACCFKYVVTADSVYPEDGLPVSALGHGASPRVARVTKLYNRPVFVQPADSKNDAENAANLKCAIDSVREHGYTLQLQIHKLINVE